jgi:hypothetical protein
MKFVHYLQKIEHVTSYAYVSLAIFGLFFIAMLFFVWRADPKKLDEINRLPLD